MRIAPKFDPPHPASSRTIYGDRVLREDPMRRKSLKVCQGEVVFESIGSYCLSANLDPASRDPPHAEMPDLRSAGGSLVTEGISPEL